MAHTILVLDDDKLFCAMVTSALAARGHRVVTAGTGAQATALLAKERPELLIVDGLLPDTRGTDWISGLRAAGNDLPIIFASAFWRELGSSRTLFEELRVAEVLAKPINPEALAERVDLEFLRRAAPAEALERLRNNLEEAPELAGPYLDDPQEAALLKIDAARTLSSKMRELADAVAKARAKRDGIAFAEARLRAQRLARLANGCGFRDLAAATGRIEERLRLLQEPKQVPTDDAWARLSDEVEMTLDVTKRATRPQADDGREARRLLVVTDDSASISHLQTLLPGRLCEVVAAGSPAEALRSAQEHAPDAALISLSLGEQALVFDIAKALRTVSDCAELSVGFVSAKPSKELSRAAKEVGVEVLLGTPLARDEVIEAVCRLLHTAPLAKPRVLVVAARRDFNEEVCFYLARFGMVGTPTSVEGAAACLRDENFDAVMVEVDAPADAALRLLRTIRSWPRWRILPLVATTGREPRDRRAALEAGADDCLSRPADFEKLAARVRLRHERAVVTREQFGQDPLTGYLPRVYFLRALAQKLADARRHNRELSLCQIHLEGLDAANRAGLEAGDALLLGLTRLLGSRFRAEDLRGRWTGATFSFCLQSTVARVVPGLLTKLAEQFRKMRFESPQQSAATGDLTFGHAAFPADGTTMMELLETADGRLEQVRHERRTRTAPPPLSGKWAVIGRLRPSGA